MSKTNLTVGDIVRPLDSIPVATPKTITKEVLEQMTRFRLGIACVVDGDGKLAGIFTDGDLRRMLLHDQKPFAAIFADDIGIHLTRNPTTVHPDMTLREAVEIMEAKQIWDLPIVDGRNVLIGLLHLHPAVKALLDIRP